MALERLIINNEVVGKHAIAQTFLSTLHAISWKDYCPVNYFPEPPQIDALDLDGYEKSSKKKQLACTGDAVIGVASDYQNGLFTSPRLLIVELRMNYTHGDNISLTALKKKVNHSKKLLLDGTCSLHDKYYFVFTTHVAEQAKRYLRNEAQEKGRMNEYFAVSVDEMKKILVDPTTLPYVPIHPETMIKGSLEPFVNDVKKINVAQLIAQLKYWGKELQNAYQSYNIDELKHLLDTIEPLIFSISVTPAYKLLTEDEQLDFEIEMEKILNFKNYL